MKAKKNYHKYLSNGQDLNLINPLLNVLLFARPKEKTKNYAIIACSSHQSWLVGWLLPNY